MSKLKKSIAGPHRKMRVYTFGKFKYYIYLSISAIFLIIYKSIYADTKNNNINNTFNNTTERMEQITIQANLNEKLKYILQWTSQKNMPFNYMGVGQEVFIDRKCLFTNCFVTSNRNYFKNVTQFDVIAFAGPELTWYNHDMLPQQRSQHQKYVFANIESAANYPLCSSEYDGFFNWTWTYRVDSDSRWGYMVVRDTNGTIIGPNKEIHWKRREDMLPVPDSLIKILRGKTRAAAWFVSNCVTLSMREDVVDQLDKVLQTKYNLSVDIYGSCKRLECSRKNEQYCDELIRKDYFFYLAFENAFSEDYVTEKLLHAVEFNALPIVFGGANYSRFLPEGSYINAADMDVEKLAKKMNDLILDFDQYSEYFRWTNHYYYQKKDKSVETDDYCSMCALLNDESKVKATTVYTDFRKWWNPPRACYSNI